ncbi:mechanosensitive ion channel family protein [Litorimonas sp. RW-G-Af-16]|uniref:mechanosensitive ion channel family protein n=2 Tax=Litorimonas sp. RW-G-Af-16 TaxID=3241168 RepID=UPI00390CD9A3
MPTNVEDFQAMLAAWADQIVTWAQSPVFLAQLAAVIAAVILAPLLAGFIKKRVPLFRATPAEDAKYLKLRQIIFKVGGFLRAILLVVLLAIFASILKSVPSLGQDWLVKLAQSLAVVFLVYRAIKVFITDPLYSKLAIWTLIPLALIFVLGYFNLLTDFLDRTVLLPMGDSPITAMTVAKLGIFGSLFFWLGNLSNSKGQSAIRSQESLDVGVREIVAKLFQIVLFGVIFFLVMGAAGIPLSGLVVVFSALGLGIGFGLQPIAANFISGLIILFDRSVKVGDFVVLPDGQQGFVEAINMRSTTVETADGKDIMVPNTKFTEEAYENWTHKDPSQRYEVEFTVSYDTDLDSLEGILIPEIMKYPKLLTEPELPDLEFRSFGDSGINMAIEFWCDGVDDGANKFTSDIGFIIWRTLKANKIEIPFPQRVVRNIK